MWNLKDCFRNLFNVLRVKKIFIPGMTRTDTDGSREGCMDTISVSYSNSLTVGVKKTKTIPLCHVIHEMTSRTYGEKKWWVVIVKDT